MSDDVRGYQAAMFAALNGGDGQTPSTASGDREAPEETSPGARGLRNWAIVLCVCAILVAPSVLFVWAVRGAGKTDAPDGRTCYLCGKSLRAHMDPAFACSLTVSQTWEVWDPHVTSAADSIVIEWPSSRRYVVVQGKSGGLDTLVVLENGQTWEEWALLRIVAHDSLAAGLDSLRARVVRAMEAAASSNRLLMDRVRALDDRMREAVPPLRDWGQMEPVPGGKKL